MIRLLTVEDAAAYTAIRHEMLTDSPWAFGSSPGHDRMGTVEAVRTWLETAEGAIVAAFDDGLGGAVPQMVAAAGVMRESSQKRRHIASIWGVYATPRVRGRGLGRAVVKGAIEVARGWGGVAQVQLSVSDSSTAARAVYESLGFVAWGREPDCLRVAGQSYEEIHMSLRV